MKSKKLFSSVVKKEMIDQILVGVAIAVIAGIILLVVRSKIPKLGKEQKDKPTNKKRIRG